MLLVSSFSFCGILNRKYLGFREKGESGKGARRLGGVGFSAYLCQAVVCLSCQSSAFHFLWAQFRSFPHLVV